MLVCEGTQAGALLQSPCHTEGHLLGISHLERRAFSVVLLGEERKEDWKLFMGFSLLCSVIDTHIFTFSWPQTGHVTLS